MGHACVARCDTEQRTTELHQLFTQEWFHRHSKDCWRTGRGQFKQHVRGRTDRESNLIHSPVKRTSRALPPEDYFKSVCDDLKKPARWLHARTGFESLVPLSAILSVLKVNLNNFQCQSDCAQLVRLQAAVGNGEWRLKPSKDTAV